MEQLIVLLTLVTGLLYTLQLSCCSSWKVRLLPVGVMAVSLYLLHYLVIEMDSRTILQWLQQDSIRRNFSILMILDILFQLQLNKCWLQQRTFRRWWLIPSPVLLCGLFYLEVYCFRELNFGFEVIAISYAFLVSGTIWLLALFFSWCTDMHLRMEWRYLLLMLSGILAVISGASIPEIAN
ncbi:MAG: hypothetical protein JO154_25610 [Chitinophaga sp.]|uniref:hypothetical protein n=1 Tax=Chitinophaga sp. TaxID=1869181 RepID=UPI0025C0FCDA|nr:hypothetical protein [Chitinophaga sp.]MBV8255998.1 hypothetical protein [Chitinophaga sp.]